MANNFPFRLINFLLKYILGCKVLNYIIFKILNIVGNKNDDDTRKTKVWKISVWWNSGISSGKLFPTQLTHL